MPPSRVLILGGTREARALAARLAGNDDWDVISSLRGVTPEPEQPAGAVRIGGFGGAAGLAGFLVSERIGVLVDATHPFAAQISAHAEAASAETGIPLVRLERPAWEAAAGDRWTNARTHEQAAGLIPPGSRVLLTVGRQNVPVFAARTDITIVARMIVAPDEPQPAHVTVITARPPFSLDGERALMAAHDVDVLVTKNSGSEAVAAKLEAARERGAQIIMIARPQASGRAVCSTVEEVVAALAHHAA